jgi:hypothetical protein
MRDRRQTERLPSILEGRIVLDQEARPLRCTIRDISVTGARIWLPDSIELPREFNLEIPVLEQLMPVRLMWSEGKTHGVMFLEELRSQTVDDADSTLDQPQPSASMSTLPVIPKNLIPVTEGILEDARQHLAQVLELPLEKIRLRLDIDP